jgi:hypothetical protein
MAGQTSQERNCQDQFLFETARWLQITRHVGGVYPFIDIWLIIRNSRLNANRMLRARKVLAYVAERLDPDEIPQENKNHPDVWLDLLCQDKVPRLSSVLTDSKLVPAKWTLQTIRTQIWRQGGDILFTYRLKSEKVEES